MWFFVCNGDLNLIFDNFYRNVFNSKIIFLAFKETDIYESEEIINYINSSYNNDNKNDKEKFNELYYLGTDGVKEYLYETLFCKLYSEYEYFIQNLIYYLYKFNLDAFKDKVYKLRREKNQSDKNKVIYFSDYLNELKSHIDDNDIINLLDYFNDVRVVRNIATHKESIVSSKCNVYQRKSIMNITEINNEIPQYEFFELKEEELNLLHENMKMLLYKLRDYLIKNNKIFRIKLS